MSTSPHDIVSSASRDLALCERVTDFFEQRLQGFPWTVRLRDWSGRTREFGNGAPHWTGLPLDVTIHTEAAARALLRGDPLAFVDAYLDGEAELDGNLYLLSDVRAHANLNLPLLRALPQLLAHRAFQTVRRARQNVRSHYDVPQEALDLYLDEVYRAYSCGIFEEPERLERAELLRVGRGRKDDFDSLERSQWRKFDDAMRFIDPRSGDDLLDVGCGYGGQLRVALESHSFRRYVGWTHSANQVRIGSALLAEHDPKRWELREGDYREDSRVYDHITSTGMISHVGPRGLHPYVHQIRRRIRSGGRYVHHALMTPHTKLPLDLYPGTVFHKRYVWPGYHWFTLGEHVRALEKSGFEIVGVRNLSDHYVKTTAAWYERMMRNAAAVRGALGETTFRAWRLYLAGSSGNLVNRGVHVYRLYCEAV